MLVVGSERVFQTREGGADDDTGLENHPDQCRFIQVSPVVPKALVRLEGPWDGCGFSSRGLIGVEYKQDQANLGNVG